MESGNEKKNIQQQQPNAARKSNDVKPNFNPNFNYQTQQMYQVPKQNSALPSQPRQQQNPTPMEIDTSKQNIPTNQFQRGNWQAEKKSREPSFQYNKQKPSYQHVSKQQRVNHVDESTDIRSIYDDSMENNCETESNDLQTTMSEQESIFLEE